MLYTLMNALFKNLETENYFLYKINCDFIIHDENLNYSVFMFQAIFMEIFQRNRMLRARWSEKVKPGMFHKTNYL